MRVALACVLAMASTLGHARSPFDPQVEVLPGVTRAHLDPGFWTSRLRDPDRLILDAGAIAAQNARMRQLDPSLHDIEDLPYTVEAAQVRAWIEAASPRPTAALYDEAGKEGSARAIDRLVAALDLDDIPQTQVTRFGLVVRRADLRTFPTHLRVFSTPDDRDLDRFRNRAVPRHAGGGRAPQPRPALAVRAQRDLCRLDRGRRRRVRGTGRGLCLPPARAVRGGDRRPGAHGAYARAPEVSELPLDMGVRLPLAEWPPHAPVNGQHPGFGYVVDLPVREADGTLAFVPALLPRSADVAEGYLPLTKANLVRQAFKFLGERWLGTPLRAATAAASFRGLRSFGL